MVRPDQPPYGSQVLDHLGLVAGMCDALGIGDVLEQATQQHPAMRDLTGGEAVKAMGLNGLGCINHARALVPRFFHTTPTYRRIAPRVAPAPLHDDAFGRALDTLDDDGVTALSSLRAATVAQCLGLAPRVAHLDRTSLHGDGRSHREQASEAEGRPITRGDRRDPRPARTQGMPELLVEPQAGMPLLRKPLRGHSHDAPACGQGVKDQRAQ